VKNVLKITFYLHKCFWILQPTPAKT